MAILSSFMEIPFIFHLSNQVLPSKSIQKKTPTDRCKHVGPCLARRLSFFEADSRYSIFNATFFHILLQQKQLQLQHQWNQQLWHLTLNEWNIVCVSVCVCCLNVCFIFTTYSTIFTYLSKLCVCFFFGAFRCSKHFQESNQDLRHRCACIRQGA